MIRISSRKEGFRRCGVAHPKGVVDYPDGQWTEEQLAALRAEPMLVVTSITTGDAGGDKPIQANAAQSIELAKAAATGEDLDKLAKGEDRKSVLAAIEKRRAELAKSAEA